MEETTSAVLAVEVLRRREGRTEQIKKVRRKKGRIVLGVRGVLAPFFSAQCLRKKNMSDWKERLSKPEILW